MRYEIYLISPYDRRQRSLAEETDSREEAEVEAVKLIKECVCDVELVDTEDNAVILDSDQYFMEQARGYMKRLKTEDGKTLGEVFIDVIYKACQDALKAETV